MIIEHFEQLSDEWFQARARIPSASNFNKIVTSKGEPSKQAKDYLYQLAGERITNNKVETYQSKAMERGIELEAEAKSAFELITDHSVREVGLCYKDEKKLYSCSPDGLVDDTMGLEIKCPLIHTHVSYLLSNKIPSKYIPQVQGSMFVTGFQFWYFLSYYPGLSPLILLIKRDEDFIGKLEKALNNFVKELDEVTDKLKSLQ